MPGKKTMKQAKKLGMKGSGYKAGKKVKMSKGMTVPNFQDTVVKKMFSGGTLKSIGSSNIKLPTGMQPVKRLTPSKKPVGQPKRIDPPAKSKTATMVQPVISRELSNVLSGKRGTTKSPSPSAPPKKPKKKTGRGDI
jgi:hypothetical protein